MSDTESSSSSDDPVPSPAASFDAYHTRLLQNTTSSTRIAASLPAPEDLSFHRSLDRKFSRAVDGCAQRILALAEQLLELTAGGSEARGKGKEKERKRNDGLKDEEDVVDRFGRLVTDVTDQLLERADTALDEHLGRIKPAAFEVKPRLTKKDQWVGPFAKSKSIIRPTGPLPHDILNASYLDKPQLKFKTPVNNYPSPDWEPTLKEKPHAQVPLGWRPEPGAEAEAQEQGLSVDHPYYFETVHLTPPLSMFLPRTPRPPQSFVSTPFTYVTTPEDLGIMLSKLRTSTEIAVDLEHHDYRSYWGFVCLMQISNREEDWVVDTLVLRDELEVLNEVFADPKIVKVLHGAQSDIIWLQRDFNLYIVNLFDTYHASKILQFPSFGLAFLLELYCDYKADKRFQLADWRIRPLPEEMLAYARSDTHFLLYIYDSLLTALLDRAHDQPNLINAVLAHSKQTAMQLYYPEAYDPAAAERLARRWNKHFDGLRRRFFEKVLEWRDRVAREEDESHRHILPNHQIFSLIENLPIDNAAKASQLQGVTAPLLPARRSELASLVRTALEEEAVARKEQETRKLAEDMARMEVRAEAVERAVRDGSAQTSGNRFAMFEERGVDESEQDVEMLPLPEPVAVTGGSTIDLWAGPADSLSTNTSALFVDDESPSESKVLLAAASSLLFGERLPTPERERKEGFEEAVARVHGGLFIAPTIHKPPSSESELSGDPVQRPPVEPASAAAVAEVPFVPKSARAAPAPSADDAIIVVGQRHGQKRKRALNLGLSVVGTSAASPTPRILPSILAEEIVEDVFPEPDEGEGGFDYSGVPNLLDADPAAMQRAKKQKRNKVQKTQYGNFKAPPKPRTEPKGSNRSQTFKA